MSAACKVLGTELAQSHLRHWLSMHFKSLSCSEFLFPLCRQGE